MRTQPSRAVQPDDPLADLPIPADGRRPALQPTGDDRAAHQRRGAVRAVAQHRQQRGAAREGPRAVDRATPTAPPATPPSSPWRRTRAGWKSHSAPSAPETTTTSGSCGPTATCRTTARACSSTYPRTVIAVWACGGELGPEIEGVRGVRGEARAEVLNLALPVGSRAGRGVPVEPEGVPRPAVHPPGHRRSAAPAVDSGGREQRQDEACVGEGGGGGTRQPGAVDDRRTWPSRTWGCRDRSAVARFPSEHDGAGVVAAWQTAAGTASAASTAMAPVRTRRIMEAPQCK